MRTLWNYAWRLAYCLAFPLFKIYVWTLARDVQGCFVAVWHEDRVLIIRNSYRRHYSVPGGLMDKGEEPLAGAVREVREEVGLRLDPTPVVLWQCLDDSTSRRKSLGWFFHVRLRDVPELHVDEREVIGAEFIRPEEALKRHLNRHLRAYLEAMPAGGPDLPAV